MDKRYQALFNALASGRGVGPESMLQALSAEGDADPRLEMLAQMMAQQQSARSDDDDDDDDGGDEDDDDVDSRRVRARQWDGASTDPSQRRVSLSRIRENMAAMRGELEDLRETNDTLAIALGACYLCWGGEPECPNCEGEGTPGYFMPDPALFNEIVRPAVSRVASAVRRRMRASRRAEPGRAEPGRGEPGRVESGRAGPGRADPRVGVGAAPQKRLTRVPARAPTATPMDAPASAPIDTSIHSIDFESEDPNNQ